MNNINAKAAGIAVIAIGAALAVAWFTGAGQNPSKGPGASQTAATLNKGTTVSSTPLKVYATASPQGDVIKYVQALADADGAGLKLQLTTSGGSGALDAYELLANGDTDVTFTGHQPYVNAWKAAHPALNNFDGKAAVLVNAFGLYSEKYTSAQALPEGAQILIPNEQTNLPRALFILQDLKLIKLNVDKLDSSPAAIAVSEKSIIDNPKHLKLVPTDTVLRAKALPDADASFINGDVALSNGVDPSRALVKEQAADNPYANLIYTRNNLLDDDRVTLLARYLTGPEVKKFIDDNYHGFVVADQRIIR
ncbi:MetQ/NlpA family ABC transporter substrate-binding protein [Pseudomonas typographi]|uniref:Metal ABC transporter substrate-binding protein n=1 Tax=Pseudomonas typographi TaxID=2715964 RepID=A0ABR7YZV7_9PSED|nr:MetQ/NlpA family ABC transporter substrate-binding protein [Pseudomonas typographi]MBD1550581.1 metal ABC transporter substrate-binding protein [Pseudomonas typographi]MBD1586834.1 metal ABC transporter substrate-binding protein [Pseudomonas typographi]MBD1598728.1 metal ABC transporter substrate-binding protein [Pseudomonas typographi]